MPFQPLTLEELILLFPDFIPTEMIEYIYKFYIPKFKVGQRCIRTYNPPKTNSFALTMSNNVNNKIKKQNVVITSIDFPTWVLPRPREYLYGYDYYPSSEGFTYECYLRALTKEEEGKNHWELPHDMESERSINFP